MKWLLDNPDYRTDTINGKRHQFDFKNVFITEEGTEEFFLPIRVYKSSEKTDMRRVNLIVNAPQNQAAINFIKAKVAELSKPDPTLEKYWGAGYLVAIEKVLEIIKKSENETLGD